MADIFTLGPSKNIAGLSATVNNYLSLLKNMETQVLNLEGGNVIIQARERGGSVKQWIGMDKAITVKIDKVDSEKVLVDIGNSKWTDKAGIMALSMVILWPLAITSGVGMYRQGKLPNEIKLEIYRYLTA